MSTFKVSAVGLPGSDDTAAKVVLTASSVLSTFPDLSTTAVESDKT